MDKELNNSKLTANCLVYKHIRLDTNEVFYVGISSTKRRPYDRSCRSEFWKNIVKKSGYRVEIVFKNLTWEQACEKEIELINLYGRRDLGNGPLVNHTDGGDGNLGQIPWNKGKKGLQKAWNKGIKGLYKASDETKKKLSKSHKGLLSGEKNPMFGTKAYNNRVVLAINIENNEIIGEFISVKEAGEKLPISHASVKKILSGTFNSIKGIRVEYK
jgi:hypothetical protein